MYILGIESSCDDTSMAVIDKNTGAIIYIKTMDQNAIHSQYQGIVPALAAAAHLLTIEQVWSDIKNQVKDVEKKIDIIAVTNGPGLTGSLLIGINFAYGLKKYFQDVFERSIPVTLCDHIEGHLLVNLCHQSVTFPFLGLILSGGHSLLIYCKKLGDYEVFSTTLDDALGECLDKCGRFIGLAYPGGIYLEKQALAGNPTVPLPVPMAKTKSNNWSFSGLKTAVFLIKNQHSPENISATIQKVVAQSLGKTIKKAMDHYQCSSMVAGGGVISNKFFREYFVGLGGQWCFPGPGLSTDSGAIPGSVAWAYYKNNQLDQLIKPSIVVYNNLKSNGAFHWI
jgi:N6-L-threonylcarbamoyladenine synthase